MALRVSLPTQVITFYCFLHLVLALWNEPGNLTNGLWLLFDDEQYLESNYRAQVKCQGTIPYSQFDIPTRILNGRTPEQVYPTVRQLCARTPLAQFPPDAPEVRDGTYIDVNRGVYCAYRSNLHRRPSIMFDKQPRQRLRGELHFWKKVLLFCESRCQRLRQAQATLPADFEDENLDLPTEEAYISGTYPDHPWELNAARPRIRDGTTTAIEIWYLPMLIYQTDDTAQAYRAFYIAPPSFERPLCEAPFPPSFLALPVRRTQYPVLQNLCASDWFGGSVYDNAAAVCSRSDQVIGFLPTLVQ
jgi:hypothetical protein